MLIDERGDDRLALSTGVYVMTKLRYGEVGVVEYGYQLIGKLGAHLLLDGD